MSIDSRNQVAIPNVPVNVDPALKQLLESLRMSVQTFQCGRTESAELDRAVTMRDLANGTVKLNRSLLVDTLTSREEDNARGTVADDLGIAVQAPTKPTGFEVAVGVSSALLSWDWPEYAGHAYTEIFRQRTELDMLGNPVDKPQFNEETLMRGTASGFVYSDELDYHSGYYYWIRHVNTKSMVGPISSTEGLYVKSARTIEDEMKAAGLANILGFDDIPDEYKGSDVIYNRQIRQLLYWNGTEYTRNIPIDGIPDGAIGLTKFARGLAPVGLHDTVPKDYANTDVVFVDGSLYRWDGKKYTANIPSINIEGVLDPSAIPSIPTSKLSGTVNANQIAANAIGANHILAGAVNTNHLAADSIVAGKIRAGAIGAREIHVGQLTADHFAVGVGGNLLVNPIFAGPGADGTPFGWRRIIYHNGTSAAMRGLTWLTEGGKITLLENENYVFQTANNTNNDSSRCTFLHQDISVTPGQFYIASAYISAHRMNGRVRVEWLNATTGVFAGVVANSPYQTNPSAMRATGLTESTRVFVKFKAPDSGRIRFCIEGVDNMDVNSQHMYIMRPQLEQCTEHTRTPAPWQLGGVTVIHGGSLVNDSITTGKIAANTIGAREIISGSIRTDHLQSGTITADKIAATQTLRGHIIEGGTITGTNITATNTVNGARINGGSIHGTQIHGTTIHGGTIYSARLESATGRFTGDLEVHQIIGGGVFQRGIALSSVTGGRGTFVYHRVRFIVHARNAQRTLMFKYVGAAGTTTNSSHVGGGSNNDGNTYYSTYTWPRNIRGTIAGGSGHIVGVNDYAVINAGSTVTVDFLFEMTSDMEWRNMTRQPVEWMLAVDSGANITIQ